MQELKPIYDLFCVGAFFVNDGRLSKPEGFKEFSVKVREGIKTYDNDYVLTFQFNPVRWGLITAKTVQSVAHIICLQRLLIHFLALHAGLNMSNKSQAKIVKYKAKHGKNFREFMDGIVSEMTWNPAGLLDKDSLFGLINAMTAVFDNILEIENTVGSALFAPKVDHCAVMNCVNDVFITVNEILEQKAHNPYSVHAVFKTDVSQINKQATFFVKIMSGVTQHNAAAKLKKHFLHSDMTLLTN